MGIFGPPAVPAGTVALYQFPPHPGQGLPISTSPFCAKLECYLRLTGRRYESRNGSPLKSPTKTVPYVDRGSGLGLEADSGAIIAALELAAEEKPGEGQALDTGLSDDHRSVAKELLKLAEERLYFQLLFSVFAEDAGWHHHRDGVKASLPLLLRPVLCGFIRNAQIKKCAEHGCVDPASTYRTTKADVERVSAAIAAAGGDGFLLDRKPRVVDCSMYAMLLAAAHVTSRNPLTVAIREDPRLMAWLDRMSTAVGFNNLPALRFESQ